MLHIPLRLSTWSFTDWHMFLLPLLWSSSCVAVAGVLCMQCSALLQLHSRLWGTRHRLLWLGADLALWLGVTGCCLSGSVRTGTKLMSLYRPIASTSEDTGLISDLYTFFYYYSNIIVRTQIHGQYLALDIHTIQTVLFLSLLLQPSREGAAFCFANRALWDSLGTKTKHWYGWKTSRERQDFSVFQQDHFCDAVHKDKHFLSLSVKK